MTDQPIGDITLQTIAMPADANANGDIFGGWLMAQMDLGASVLARRRARGRVATVAVDAMVFHQPVQVGDVVSIYSHMTREGRTSMAVAVEVWTQAIGADLSAKVTQAVFTFVAIDDSSRPRPLP